MANLEFILYELLSTTTDIIKKHTKKFLVALITDPITRFFGFTLCGY